MELGIEKNNFPNGNCENFLRLWADDNRKT